MAAKKPDRKDVPRSYRFDPETADLLDRLTQAMSDPDTGQPRSATDVLRQGVRILARKYLRNSQD